MIWTKRRHVETCERNGSSESSKRGYKREARIEGDALDYTAGIVCYSCMIGARSSPVDDVDAPTKVKGGFLVDQPTRCQDGSIVERVLACRSDL